MNVVYILNSTYALGGASKSFMSMLEGLKNKGVKPIVVVPDHEGLCKILHKKGIETIVVCFRPCTYPHNRTSLKDILLFIPKLLARRFVNRRAVTKLYKKIRDREIQLIHTNVSVIDIGIRLSQKMNIPHIFHVREYADLDFHEIYYPTSRYFHKKILNSSYTICITKHIQAHHGLTGNASSKVIYNGINVPMIDSLKIEKKEYFLFAGRIDPSKGLHILLKAYENYLKRSTVKRDLWIAGDLNELSYYNKLTTFIKDNKLNNKIRFLGGRKDIYKLMQESTAIIIPSRFEGFGRCMAEAMLNGCFVIGHDTAGLKEQFDNGLDLTKREIGFRYQTTEALSERLLQIDQMQEEKKARYIADAYYTANKLYTPTANCEQIYQFYKEILQ